MFGVWRLLCWSGVTVLFNHCDDDIDFYIESPIFPGDGRKRIFTLKAQTPKLIDKRRLDPFRESDVDTTVTLVSRLSGCGDLTRTPNYFSGFCVIKFRVSGNQLESYGEIRRRRFTERF